MMQDVNRWADEMTHGRRYIEGFKVVTNAAAPRPGAIFMADHGAIVVNPDEEHMVWAASGLITEAFEVLDRTIQHKINMMAFQARNNVYTHPFHRAL